MSNRPYFAQSWAERRAQGQQRCTWTAKRNERGRADRDVGHRQGAIYKGMQCKRWVAKDQVAANGGVPICYAHMPAYNERVEAMARLKAHARSKLDPGPLYEEP